VAARSVASLVLLVDDEPDQVEMYQLALELSGFMVVVAYTGADGIARAHERDPAAIVLDIRLPDISGWDVCSSLKRDPLTEQIPIIVLTAAVSPTLAEQAATAGCAAHLVKPCFPDQLVRTVREVIAAHEQA
jgi:two-component system cell cycle response regulator DivK